MSDQDIFADIEDNEADDPEPVEFTPISGSGSTASLHTPQQQAGPSAPPVIEPAAEPSPNASATCHLCHKTCKSVRGLKTHYKRSHKDVAVPDLTAEISVSVPPAIPSTVPNRTQNQFVCSVCRSVLTTQAGFIKHQGMHKLKDAYKKMPQASEFNEGALVDTVIDILGDILKEPNYGSPKRDFVQGIIDNKGSDVWFNFVHTISDFICSMVFKIPTKILPANQYEEFLKGLNSFLNDNDSVLQEKIKAVCPAVDISSSLAGRLVFRIASMLLQKIQVWVIQKVRDEKDQEAARISLPEVTPMNELEKKAFLIHLGDVFLSYFKKKHSCSPRQCECLKTNFVDGQHPISRAHFLDKKKLVFWGRGVHYSQQPCFRILHHHRTRNHPIHTIFKRGSDNTISY